jgi:hypothetical protein
VPTTTSTFLSEIRLASSALSQSVIRVLSLIAHGATRQPPWLAAYRLQCFRPQLPLPENISQANDQN